MSTAVASAPMVAHPQKSQFKKMPAALHLGNPVAVATFDEHGNLTGLNFTTVARAAARYIMVVGVDGTFHRDGPAFKAENTRLVPDDDFSRTAGQYLIDHKVGSVRGMTRNLRADGASAGNGHIGAPHLANPAIALEAQAFTGAQWLLSQGPLTLIRVLGVQKCAEFAAKI